MLIPPAADTQVSPATESYQEAIRQAGRNHVAAIEAARDQMHETLRPAWSVWHRHQQAARRIFDQAIEAADQTYDAATQAAQAVYETAISCPVRRTDVRS